MTLKTETLILGGGITGLALSWFMRDSDTLVLEKESRSGGLCRTTRIKKINKTNQGERPPS